jgi:hypothetical protein
VSKDDGYKILLQIVSLVTLMVGMITLEILVLMYGWGLEPKSWAWIIVGGVFAQIGLRIVAEAIKKP